MKTAQELQKLLHQIDHKGYKAYKELKGTYQLKDYILCIDSVQGDPFATPSRVRLIVKNKGNFDTALFDQKHRKIATEDEILRNIHRFLKKQKGNGRTKNSTLDYGRSRAGSGKSGQIFACRVRQDSKVSLKLTSGSFSSQYVPSSFSSSANIFRLYGNI